MLCIVAVAVVVAVVVVALVQTRVFLVAEIEYLRYEIVESQRKHGHVHIHGNTQQW